MNDALDKAEELILSWVAMQVEDEQLIKGIQIYRSYAEYMAARAEDAWTAWGGTHRMYHMVPVGSFGGNDFVSRLNLLVKDLDIYFTFNPEYVNPGFIRLRMICR